jgi:hypothetical protein
MSWMNTEWPEGCQHDFVRSGHGDLAAKWNDVVRDFLDSDCDWLWSCHTDVEFFPGTLKRLLSWDEPLVTALLFMRNGAAVPHVWEGRPDTGKPGYIARVRETFRWLYINHPEAVTSGPYIVQPRPSDALCKVDFTSTSCTLMHRKVFEAIEPPWFFADVPVGGGSRTSTWAAGEDRYFYEKALAAGYEAYVDRSCIVGHMPINVSVGALDFGCWMTAWDPIGKEEAMMACNLGANE